MKRICFYLLFVVCYLLFPKVSAAEEQSIFSLGVYPPVIAIDAKVPSKIETTISIQNRSAKKELLEISLRPFKPTLDGSGQIEYLEEESRFDSVKKGLRFYDHESEVTKIALGPYENKDLKLEVTLDAKVVQGDHYFSIIFTPIKEAQSTTSSSSIITAIATNVILSIGEKSNTLGNIINFSVPTVVLNGPVPFVLLVENQSLHYIVVRGRISIYDMFGRDVGRVDILPQYVLSTTKKYLTDTISATSSANIHHPKLIWPRKFLFGVYNAQLVAKLSEDGPTFKTSIYFIAFPAYLILLLSLIAFFALGLYIGVMNKMRK